MEKKSKGTGDETIETLRRLVVDVNYSVNLKTSSGQIIDRVMLKRLAKNVEKHLSDDSLSAANPARS